MSVLQIYGKEIVAFFVPFIAWALNTFLKSKARLNVATPHRFTFLVQQPLLDKDGKQISPTQTVHTNSIVVYNSGRDSATKVELVFNWKPMCVNIWPPRHSEEFIEADRRYVLIFPGLAPNEMIGCEILSVNEDLPNLLTVRSDQCTAQVINMFPQPVSTPLRRRINSIMFGVGFATSVYLLIILVQWLVLKTPAGP